MSMCKQYPLQIRLHMDIGQSRTRSRPWEFFQNRPPVATKFPWILLCGDAIMCAFSYVLLNSMVQCFCYSFVFHRPVFLFSLKRAFSFSGYSGGGQSPFDSQPLVPGPVRNVCCGQQFFSGGGPRTNLARGPQEIMEGQTRGTQEIMERGGPDVLRQQPCPPGLGGVR